MNKYAAGVTAGVMMAFGAEVKAQGFGDRNGQDLGTGNGLSTTGCKSGTYNVPIDISKVNPVSFLPVGATVEVLDYRFGKTTYGANIHNPFFGNGNFGPEEGCTTPACMQYVTDQEHAHGQLLGQLRDPKTQRVTSPALSLAEMQQEGVITVTKKPGVLTFTVNDTNLRDNNGHGNVRVHVECPNVPNKLGNPPKF